MYLIFSLIDGMALEKDLKIKTGIVTRLYKEYHAYLKEEENQKKRIERIKSEGADEHDIRKQVNLNQAVTSSV